jgi:hypothetical protein
VDDDIDRVYATEIAVLRQPAEMDAGRMARIVAALTANARTRAPRLLGAGQRLQCRIDVTDLSDYSIVVDCTASGAQIEPCDRRRLAPLVLSTRLAVLEAWATQEYGYESLSIGYGAVLQATSRDMLLRNVLLAVLGRKPLPPAPAQRWLSVLRHPLRTFDLWRRDLHLKRLAMRVRSGDVQRWNDIYSADPERWSPIRAEPLPVRRSA